MTARTLVTLAALLVATVVLRQFRGAVVLRACEGLGES